VIKALFEISRVYKLHCILVLITLNNYLQI